jgi:hypothetical protein
VPEYSKQDIDYASEFRDGIHRDALEIVRKTRPDVSEVIDRHPVEDYFQEHWDYPGRWYTVVAIPYGYSSRKALIDSIVKATLTAAGPAEHTEPDRHMLDDQLDDKPSGYRELFVLDSDQQNRSFRAVGVDAEGRYILEHYEEYSICGDTGSKSAYYVLTELQFRRYARQSLLNGRLNGNDYDRFTAETKHDL